MAHRARTNLACFAVGATFVAALAACGGVVADPGGKDKGSGQGPGMNVGSSGSGGGSSSGAPSPQPTSTGSASPGCSLAPLTTTDPEGASCLSAAQALCPNVVAACAADCACSNRAAACLASASHEAVVLCMLPNASTVEEQFFHCIDTAESCLSP